jgi:hypothetical protein
VVEIVHLVTSTRIPLPLQKISTQGPHRHRKAAHSARSTPHLSPHAGRSTGLRGEAFWLVPSSGLSLAPRHPSPSPTFRAPTAGPDGPRGIAGPALTPHQQQLWRRRCGSCVIDARLPTWDCPAVAQCTPTATVQYLRGTWYGGAIAHSTGIRKVAHPSCPGACLRRPPLGSAPAGGRWHEGRWHEAW